MDSYNSAEAVVTAGYSAKTAGVNASKLLVDISIAKRVTELISQCNYRTKIGNNYVLRRQVEIDS